MRLAACPPPSDLERLFLGGMPEENAETVEQHVLECAACLQRLKQALRGKDTLGGLLSADTRSDGVAADPRVGRLAAKLKALRQEPAIPPQRGAAMIPFTCPACQKQLRAKEELAGKKVKCPGCGQSAPVPAQAAVAPPAAADMPTLPPADAGGSSASSSPDKSGASEAFDAAHAGHDAGLTDFLAPPQAPDELGRLGKYRILKVLGHGGMGVVFQAEDSKLKRYIALKAMLPAMAASASAGQRFLREAQAMAAVEHDHIVRIYQVDEDRGVPFLAMEFLKGEPLDARLKREGASLLPLPEVLRIGREVAEALAAAHVTGLIHRDVKPGNIWLDSTQKGRVKILDFGLARAGQEDVHLTRSGAIVGTPAYMAPEQARGEKVDARGDLFSLGCVLYKLLTGEMPFVGDTTTALLLALALDHPKPVRERNADCPARLSDLVMQMLEKDPAKRPQSAREVIQALQAVERPPATGLATGIAPAVATPAVVRKQSIVQTPSAPKKAKRGQVMAAWLPRRKSSILAGATIVLLLAGLGVLWAAGAFRLKTQDGTIVVENLPADAEVFVDDEKVAVHLKGADRPIEIQVAPGKRKLEIKAGGFKMETQEVTLESGERKPIGIRLEPLAAVELPAAGDTAWVKQVAAMSTARQLEAVTARLKELNPGFDGELTPKIEGGVITGLQLSTEKIWDISPVRVLTGLRTLDCSGPVGKKGLLADLSPLKDMKLTSLNCGFTQVSDLDPLKDMKLTFLNCWDTPVADLFPLRGMPLTNLNCPGTKVSDLSPLKDMPLTHLDVGGLPISDLSPLKGMPLTELCIKGTQVSDLSPLKGMPLTFLQTGQTQVSDLTPLKDMKSLTTLMCYQANVTDLSPLKDVPLQWLVCDLNPERDAKSLRLIKTLLRVNDKPMAEFWKEVDDGKKVHAAAVPKENAADDVWARETAALGSTAKQREAVAARLKERNPGFDGNLTVKVKDGVITELEMSAMAVRDLSPLRGLPGLRRLICPGNNCLDKSPLADLSPLQGLSLTDLDCSCSHVPDLSPLKGMKLTWLECSATDVNDLSPLNGVPLQFLHIEADPVDDLSPLKGMPLTDFDCNATRILDLSPLKGMRLQHLNCAGMRNSDLSPLKDMPLTDLNILNTPVTDLSPLKGMPLTSLNIQGTRVADLSPLKGMPLTWLTIGSTPVTDLRPLKGLPLKELWCGATAVSDLSPLKGMPLTNVDFPGTHVSDLTQLKGLELTRVNCLGTPVSDLSPLMGMPLKELRFDVQPKRDAAVLRSIPTLEWINEKPAAEFWKEVDAKKP